MDYEIYSYGGGEVLWKVFNVVELMFKDESYYGNLSKLTASVSLLLVAMRCINKGSMGFLFKEWLFPVLAITNLLIVPTVSVHIIDPIDQDFRYSKVDNIPIGLAQTACLVSSLSHHLTNIVEKYFCSSTSTAKFSTTGPLFGARLANLARQVRIKDPIMRENVKNYVRQCFMWPYVFGNIAPGKKAALESDNILGFIKANPHPGLGIYWRDTNGNAEFKACSDCTTLVETAMTAECTGAEQSITAKLFGIPKTGQTQVQLRKYFSDGWAQISKKTAQAADIVQQNLMINAFREAFDDKREEFGLGRIDPTLISLNAGRAQAQQNNTFLVKGALAGENMPMMHSVVFALLVLAFVFIIPLTLLTQGTKMLLMWFKMMIAVSLWPVIFAVFDGFGSIYAANSVASIMIGTSGDLTILTQNGMADAAFDVYCWTVSMQMAIPIIAWAFVSGGGYAISQLSSSFTSGIEAGASKAGNEMVDGNLSFDAQTLHHRSVANSQIAQQTLGAMTSSGMRLDDGKTALLFGPNGKVTAQEHLPNLATNMSQNDTASLAFSMQGQIAAQTAHGKSVQANQSYQSTISEMHSLAKSASKGIGLTEGFGNTESAQAQESFSKVMDAVRKIQKTYNVNDTTAFQMAVSASIGNGGSSKGKGFLGLFNAGVSANASSSADHQKQIGEIQNSGIAENFAENFNKGMQYMIDKKGSVSDSTQQQKVFNIQHGIQTTNTYADQTQASYNESQQWMKQASAARNEATSVNMNKTDKLVDHVAETQFNGNKIAALKWANDNPDLFANIGRNIIHNQEQEYGRSAANSGVSYSQNDVKRRYENDRQSVQNTVSDTDMKKARQSHKNVMKSDDQIKKEVVSLKHSTKQQIKQINPKEHKEVFVNTVADTRKQFVKQKARSSVSRATEGAVHSVGHTGKAVIDTAINFIPGGTKK